VKRVPIISSAIRSAGHSNGVLEIEFSAGHLAWYMDVPVEIFRDLVRSPSPGRFFNESIKTKFDCTNSDGVHTRAGQVEAKPKATSKRGKKPGKTGGAAPAPVRDLNPGYDPHGTKGVARARAVRGLRVQRG
jgi:KTSC domain